MRKAHRRFACRSIVFSRPAIIPQPAGLDVRGRLPASLWLMRHSPSFSSARSPPCRDAPRPPRRYQREGGPEGLLLATDFGRYEIVTGPAKGNGPWSPAVVGGATFVAPINPYRLSVLI